MRVLAALADILAPRVCVGCGHEGSWLCASCADTVPLDANAACGGCGRLSIGAATCAGCRRSFGVDGMLAVAPYRAPLAQRVIHTVKYAPARDAAGAFASFVDRFLAGGGRGAIVRAVGDSPCVVPVPLHRSRLAERGFNQSRKIAEFLAAATGGRVVDALARIRGTPPQVELRHDARADNVRDAFRCIHGAAVHGAAVLLVDDVVTTGATVTACARVLRDAGALRVWAFAIARG